MYTVSWWSKLVN